MLIPRHTLVCFIFSPRYARLAADVSQQVASLHWYRRSCWWVAILTQPQQIGVPYKVSTFSALPGPLPVLFLLGGKVNGLNATCTTCSQKEKLCNIHILHPEIAAGDWHSVGEPCMTAPEKCDKTIAAGDISQPSLWNRTFKMYLFSCPFCWQCFRPLYIFYLTIKHYIVKNYSRKQLHYSLLGKNTVLFLYVILLKDKKNVKKIWNPCPVMKIGSCFALWQVYTFFVPHHTS